MLSFLKYVFATIVGLILFSVLSFFILLGIGAAVSTTSTYETPGKSILHLKLREPILERSVDNPLDDFNIPNNISESGMGLITIKKAIKNAKKTENIKGIFLDLENIMAGMATIEEIRQALKDFKQSGKFIFAYGDSYSENAYYLASIADKIYLNPMGKIELNGLHYELLFFDGTFEKLNIEPQVFKVGKYKSAVEPFTRKNMSESNRMQINALMNSLYGNYTYKVGKERKIPQEKLNLISDSMKVRTAEDAVKYQLADKVFYYDQVIKVLKDTLGVKKDKQVSLVSLSDFKNAKNNINKNKGSDNKIAVILASGEIRKGKGEGQQVIGSDKICRELRKVRNNKGVKGVVLRINSPGGSALASDMMWREIILTAEKKPVIASMSDVAASGGYYLAMGCDTIVAHKNTITGSIGVFGLLFNIKDFLNNKLGITVDGVKTGAFSDIKNSTRPLTDAEKRIIQNDIENIYQEFIQKASRGRGMAVKQIKELASGRVWTGDQAKSNGLVDVLGGMQKAVEIAANKAGIKDDFKIKYYPAKKGFIEKLMSDFQIYTVNKLGLKPDLGPLEPYRESLEKLPYMQGIQARMPYNIKIK